MIKLNPKKPSHFADRVINPRKPAPKPAKKEQEQ